MSAYKTLKLEKLSLKQHPQLNEKWVQDQIAFDPTILGLGKVFLKDKERIQPRGGRLDLLLQDSELNRRYEVEVQLGSSDESHIIRTIEYWDIERKRYPQYDHCAVIIAEQITTRFLNVISLFNGTIPLIAIQMSAYQREDEVALIFHTVLNEMQRGLVDEDEEIQPTTDRQYWETKASAATIALAEQVVSSMREFAPGLQLSFKKHYMGLTLNGQANNFVYFEPKTKFLLVKAKLEQSSETQQMLDASTLDADYDPKYSTYRVRIHKSDLGSDLEVLKKLLKMAHDANV